METMVILKKIKLGRKSHTKNGTKHVRKEIV